MAVLNFTDRGLYCPAGDFYVDPWRPVDRALITHGHADHARAGHNRYLMTKAAEPVIRHRLGKITSQTTDFAKVHQIGGAKVSFHPAGHVPGSAQIRIEVAGEVWVASGDYKVENDGLSEAFEPVQCHSFITECTFGLPVFSWQPQARVAQQINDWWRINAANGLHSLLGAYSLGKAQRLLNMIDSEIGPILCHTAVENTNAVMRNQGLVLPETTLVTPDTDIKSLAPAMIVAPPSAFGSNWARQFGRVSTGFASGWMQMRGVRRRRSVDRGFVVSDHADWDGLNQVIKETGAENIYTTHGYTDIFARWLSEQGYNAQLVQTEFNGDNATDEAE